MEITNHSSGSLKDPFDELMEDEGFASKFAKLIAAADSNDVLDELMFGNLIEAAASTPSFDGHLQDTLSMVARLSALIGQPSVNGQKKKEKKQQLQD